MWSQTESTVCGTLWNKSWGSMDTTGRSLGAHFCIPIHGGARPLLVLLM